MRKIVFYEGKILSGHEMIFRPGAVDIPSDAEFPVVTGMNYENTVGWAYLPTVDNETGAVSFEFRFFVEGDEERYKDSECSMYLTNVVVHKPGPDEGGYQTVEDATLRGISLIDHKIEWREP